MFRSRLRTRESRTLEEAQSGRVDAQAPEPSEEHQELSLSVDEGAPPSPHWATDGIGARMSELADVSRKLVAVFAADVEGYSRLMGTDEVGTLKGLTERRAILDRLIGDHRGRIANTAGDSVLAEFGSAVDAVQCAVDAQAALAEANSNLSPDKRISFRIGVQSGT